MTNRFVKFAKDILIFGYWYILRFLVLNMPPAPIHRIARLAAQVAWKVSRGGCRRLNQELHVVGVNLDREEETVREALFVRFCNELEVLAYPSMSSKNINGFVSCEGLSHLDEALRAEKGVMLLFAHFGANQMIMPAIGCRGYRMSQLSAPPTVLKEILPAGAFSAMEIRALKLRWEQEQSLPVAHINVFGPLREAFDCLKSGDILGIAMDGGGGRNRLAVDFLGRKAFFSTGAFKIAMSMGCVVLPVFMIRMKSGRNKMIVEPPLPIRGDSRSTETIRDNLRLFVDRLEHYIREKPSHYLNFLAFRRFMTTQGDPPFIVEGGTTHSEIMKPQE